MFPCFNVVNINTWHDIPFLILFAVIYRLCNRLHLSIIWGYTKLGSCEHLAVSTPQKSSCSMSGKLHLHSCSALQCADTERDISPCPKKEYFIIYNLFEYLCLKIQFCNFVCVGYDTHFNSITMLFFHGSYHYNSFCISGALQEFSVIMVHTFEIKFLLSFLRSTELYVSLSNGKAVHSLVTGI